MQVRELIEFLEDMPEDAEVRLAHQPSYPFEYSIGDVVEVSGHGQSCPECDTDWDVHVDQGCDEPVPEDDDEPSVVYIAEKSQLGYLSGHASRELGWR